LKKVYFPIKSLLNNQGFSIELKSTVTVGAKFLILQLSSLTIYSIGNIMIYSDLGKYAVTQYDTVNRCFLLGMTVYNIIISIFWTEISKAKALRNVHRLRKLRSYLYVIALIVSIISISMIIICPYFVNFWTKGIVQIESFYVIFFVILFSVQTIAYAGAVFLNAFEKLKIQIILAIISTILMIPLSKILFKTTVGIGAIPLSSAILTFPALLFCFFESKKCINSIDKKQ
jgi:O-antigen/teichoic acid export membrane protein